MALDGGERSVSCPDPFTPREWAIVTQWMVDWVGPRAGQGSGRCGEEKHLLPCRESNHDSS
jgi:hypothetical protein